MFVVHGDPGPAGALADRIGNALGWPATVRADGERLALE